MPPAPPASPPPTFADGPLVRFEGVTKRFGDKVVFEQLDLQVLRGETLALLGRSGSGKSVTLKLLLGLLRPERGRIYFAGVELTAQTERRLVESRRRIGMVFQGGALFDSLTVAENVAYGLIEQRRFKREQLRARVAECLALVDLPGTESLMPAALSGGMRKRVAIARAIAPAPELLLYDEPTTGLDPATARRVNMLIRGLQTRLGVTGIVVTHDMTAVFATADRLAIIEDGRVGWAGAVAEARAAPPPTLMRFLGETQEEQWNPPAGLP